MEESMTIPKKVDAFIRLFHLTDLDKDGAYGKKEVSRGQHYPWDQQL